MAKTKKIRIKPALVFLVAAMLCLTAAIVMVCVVSSVNKKEIAKEKERKQILGSAEIPDGVTISGVDVGGMNYDEAVAAVRTSAEAEIANSIGFKLTYEDKEYEIDASSFVLTFDTEDVVNEALSMIKDSGYIALKNYMAEVKDTGVAYEIKCSIDSDPLEDRIEEICDDIYIAPKNATAKIKSDLRIGYSSIINGNPFTFTSDVDGLQVDKKELLKTLDKRIEDRDFSDVEIPVKVAKAKISLETLKKNTVMRAYFSTEFRGSSSNRIHNVNHAAEKLNGTCVRPGETFSMEKTIGRRVDPMEWKEAPAVIAGGAAHENQLGGGVCQVATTLYNAVVKSDLKIVYRKNHSTPSSYVDRGLDATINTDTIDFKWKNNQDFNIYIFSWTDLSRSTIYCVVYGPEFPDTFDRIEFKSTHIKTIEPTETRYIQKSSFKTGEWCLYNHAVTGYEYESYAYYYKGSKLVDTKMIDTSNYKMHPKTYYVWPGYTEGARLDPYLEMVESDGVYKRKYNSTPTPTQAPQPTPASSQEPAPNQP